MFALGVIPGVALGIRMFFLTDTTRWLGSNGTGDEATDVTRRVVGDNARNQIDPIHKRVEAVKRPSWRDVLKQGERAATIVGISTRIALPNHNACFAVGSVMESVRHIGCTRYQSHGVEPALLRHNCCIHGRLRPCDVLPVCRITALVLRQVGTRPARYGSRGTHRGRPVDGRAGAGACSAHIVKQRLVGACGGNTHG